MGDTENEMLDNVGAVDTDTSAAREAGDDVTVEELTAQAAKAATKKKAGKKGNTGFWASLKGEFKKIIWPNGQTLTKETVSVILGSVILGLIIALVDLGIRVVLELII